jgi:hypothetical protein
VEVSVQKGRMIDNSGTRLQATVRDEAVILIETEAEGKREVAKFDVVLPKECLLF